jgi:hypothetical protein
MQAVLDGEIASGLVQVVAAGGDKRCQSLAAAVVAVSLIRYPNPQALTEICNRALSAAAANLTEQQRTAAPVDADAFYMVANLAQLARQNVPVSEDLGTVVSNTLQLWPRLLESGHLLAISMALTLMTSATRASAPFQREVLASGAVGMVLIPSAASHSCHVPAGRVLLRRPRVARVQVGQLVNTAISVGGVRLVRMSGIWPLFLSVALHVELLTKALAA